MGHTKTKIKIVTYNAKKRLIATLLFFCMLFQNCTYGVASYSFKTKAEESLEKYQTKITDQEERKNFQEHVAPIIIDKIANVEPESRQKEILEKLFHKNIIYHEVLKDYEPKDWLVESLKDHIKSGFRSVEAYKFFTSHLLEMLAKLGVEFFYDLNIRDLSHKVLKKYFVKTGKQTNQNLIHHAARDFLHFNPDKSLYTEFLKITNDKPEAEVYKEFQKILVGNTFQPDKKLNKQKIVDKIVNKSPKIF